MSDDTANDANKPISFMASIAPLQSAITISGDGNGIRLKLDIPESDLLPFLHTLAMRGQAFKVTIESVNYGKESTTKSTY